MMQKLPRCTPLFLELPTSHSILEFFYHVFCVHAFNDVPPPLLPALCLGTLCRDKKSQAQEQDDEKATKESWNSIQLEPLSSEDPSPLDAKESEVKDYGPDRDEFKKAQHQDRDWPVCSLKLKLRKTQVLLMLWRKASYTERMWIRLESSEDSSSFHNLSANGSSKNHTHHRWQATWPTRRPKRRQHDTSTGFQETSQ